MSAVDSPGSTTPASVRPRRDKRRPQIGRRGAGRIEASDPGQAGSALATNLGICLHLADEGSPYFPSIALRCRRRLLDSCPQMPVVDRRAASAALSSLRGPHRYAAAETLRGICAREEQDEAVQILDAWIVEPPYDARSGDATSAHALIDLET